MSSIYLEFRNIHFIIVLFSEGFGTLALTTRQRRPAFYDRSHTRFWALGVYEMWRAVRLVVDTGISCFAGSRASWAIDYLAAAYLRLTDKAVEESR